MQNRDILSIMAPKMSNETLAVLYEDRHLRASLRVILSSNDYWFQKSEYLVGKQLAYRPKADYKQVYLVLERADSDYLLLSQVINNLHSLLAVVETKPSLVKPTYWNGYQIHLNTTRNLDVFDYLLEKQADMTTGNTSNMWALLQQLGHKDCEAIVDRILSILPNSIEMSDSDPDLHLLLIAAMRADRMDVYDMLEKYIDEDTEMNQVIEEAMRLDKVRIYQRIRQAYEPDEYLIQRLVEQDAVNILTSIAAEAVTPSLRATINAGTPWGYERGIDMVIQSDSVKILKALVDTGGYDSEDYLSKTAIRSGSLKILQYLKTFMEIDWMYAIQRPSKPELLQYALDHLEDRDIDLSKELLAAVSNIELFSILLQDSRSHPEKKLTKLLEAANSSRHKSKLIEMIVLDPRVRVQDMHSDAVYIVYSNMLDIPDLDDRDLVGTDARSLMLRQIVFKRPTAVELLDWMVSLHSRDMARAAECVLDSKFGTESEDIASVVALLYWLLHPEFTYISVIVLIEEMYELEDQDQIDRTLIIWKRVRSQVKLGKSFFPCGISMRR